MYLEGWKFIWLTVTPQNSDQFTLICEVLLMHRQPISSQKQFLFLIKFTEMASLLREQTRVKESLEGALERQKEGTLLFDNNCL